MTDHVIIVYLLGLAAHLVLLAVACKRHREKPTWRSAFFVVFWPVTFLISLGVGYAETCT